MEFWQQLLVSLIGGLLGGGIIDAYLNWKRFRREEDKIKKEEQRVAIDSIRSVICVTPWKLSDKMSDKLQLYILKHKLEGSVRECAIVAEFLVRNLTDDEVVITNIEIDFPGVPAFDFWDSETDDVHPRTYTDGGIPYVQPVNTDFKMYDMWAFYDWKTHKETEIEYVTLKPKATFPIACVSVYRFCAIRRLNTPPKSIAVTVHSTGGHSVTEVLALTESPFPRFPNLVDKYRTPKNSVEWDIAEAAKRKKEEEAKRKPPEEPPEEGEEIPF
jgi:hypothetical protein